jgi:hypothetical protein
VEDAVLRRKTIARRTYDVALKVWREESRERQRAGESVNISFGDTSWNECLQLLLMLKSFFVYMNCVENR